MPATVGKGVLSHLHLVGRPGIPATWRRFQRHARPYGLVRGGPPSSLTSPQPHDVTVGTPEVMGPRRRQRPGGPRAWALPRRRPPHPLPPRAPPGPHLRNSCRQVSQKRWPQVETCTGSRMGFPHSGHSSRRLGFSRNL